MSAGFDFGLGLKQRHRQSRESKVRPKVKSGQECPPYTSLNGLQETLKLRGQRGREGQRLSCPGMLELQSDCMQEISGEREPSALFAADFARRTVQRVPCNRVPQRCQMDANLVSAAGVDFHFQE